MKRVLERKRERVTERVREIKRELVKEIVSHVGLIEVSRADGLSDATTMTTRGAPGSGSRSSWRGYGGPVGQKIGPGYYYVSLNDI